MHIENIQHPITLLAAWTELNFPFPSTKERADDRNMNTPAGRQYTGSDKNSHTGCDGGKMRGDPRAALPYSPGGGSCT